MKEHNLTWLAALMPGWRAIYVEAVEQLHAHDPAIRVMQAKEKFAELRIYLADEDDAAYVIIDAARAASAQTCDICAGRGALVRTSDGYYATRCPAHADGFIPAVVTPNMSVRLHVGADDGSDWSGDPSPCAGNA